MPQLPVDLAILEAIVAVAEAGSFSEASNALGISQSAVSARIRSAENILGIELFHRTTRKVQITRHGARLKARAEHALADLRAMFEEFSDELRLIRGRVRVGATPTVSAILLPDIVRKFGLDYPGIQVTIHDDFFGEALERVAIGEVDFALTPVNVGVDIPNVDFEHLYTEEMVVLAPQEHPLTRENPVTLAAIARFPIVSMPERAASYHQLKQAFERVGLQFEPQMQTMHALSSIAIVRAGLAVTFVPEGLLKFLNLDRMRRLNTTEIDLGRRVAIATARDRNPQPAAAALIDLIRQQVGKNDASMRTRRNRIRA